RVLRRAAPAPGGALRRAGGHGRAGRVSLLRGRLVDHGGLRRRRRRLGQVDPMSERPARLTLRVVGGVREVEPAAWDALVGDGSPFLEWAWLSALEESGSAARRNGWLPQHLTVWEGARLVGACPLYLKAHSMGEFVFDQSWASAAMRAGIEYYPKLLVAVPFTPVTGARFL